MLLDFRESISSYFDKKWLLSAVVPCLVGVGINFVFALILFGHLFDVSNWGNLGIHTKILFAILTIIALTVSSVFLSSHSSSILRLWQGYWLEMDQSFLSRTLRCVLKAIVRADIHVSKKKQYEKDILEKLELPTPADLKEEIALWQRLSSRYPLNAEEILPTALGNILICAEVYVRLRYGIDANIIWPRLSPLIPKDVAEVLSSTRNSLVFVINLATILTLSSIGWLVATGILCACYMFCIGHVSYDKLYLFIEPPLLLAFCWILWREQVCFCCWVCGYLIMMLLGYGLSVVPTLTALQLVCMNALIWSGLLSVALLLIVKLLYQSALELAASYAEMIKLSFDLYRQNLINQLNLEAPLNLQSERLFWKEMNFFYFRGLDFGFPFRNTLQKNIKLYSADANLSQISQAVVDSKHLH